MFNWLQQRSHILAHNRLYLATAIVIFTSSYLNAAWWGGKGRTWIGGGVTQYFFNLLFSLVFRVGRRRKQQAAQRGRDPASTGENRENGWKRGGETPSCRHPDVWREDRMGTGSRCAGKRSLCCSWADQNRKLLWLFFFFLIRHPDRTNRDSLALMETCLCVVCLDEPSGLEPRDGNRALLMLHGGGGEKNGANRWYDKSLQVRPPAPSSTASAKLWWRQPSPSSSWSERTGCAESCASIRLSRESWWFSAPNLWWNTCETDRTFCRIAESFPSADAEEVQLLFFCRAGSLSETARTSSVRDLPPPRRLLWKCNPQILALISASGDRLDRWDWLQPMCQTHTHTFSQCLCFRFGRRLVNNLDMDVFTFKAYGKEFIKKQKMSPDAFIQVALQLAFFK